MSLDLESSKEHGCYELSRFTHYSDYRNQPERLKLAAKFRRLAVSSAMISQVNNDGGGTVMKNLRVRNRKIGSVAVLDLEGKLEDAGTNVILQKVINRLVDKGQNQILLNLVKMSAIDSGCLSQLVARQIVLKKKGGLIKLFHLPQNLLDSNTIKILSGNFDVYESEAEAIDSFRIRAPETSEKKSARFSETCYKKLPLDWGLRGMSVTFRSELMPNRSLLERTFTIRQLLPSGRVTVNGIQGKYVKESFEDTQSIQFGKLASNRPSKSRP